MHSLNGSTLEREEYSFGLNMFSRFPNMTSHTQLYFCQSLKYGMKKKNLIVQENIKHTINKRKIIVLWLKHQHSRDKTQQSICLLFLKGKVVAELLLSRVDGCSFVLPLNIISQDTESSRFYFCGDF